MKIETAHHAALLSCVRNHAHITMPVFTALYEIAHACASGRPPENTTGILTSAMSVTTKQHGNLTIGTATDQKTGVYVQLAVNPLGKAFLTTGQKWAMEQTNEQGTGVLTYW
jgi:hypothetical protein